MPDILDFSDLFADSETDFERLPKGAGHYDYASGGRWVPGQVVHEPCRGIIRPLSHDELQFDPGGTYTRKDRKVYVQLPYSLEIDDHIRYREEVYRVLEELDYTESADFHVYIAKRVDTKGREPVAEPPTAP